MKTQKIRKAVKCSKLRRFAVNAKVVKRKLKGFAFGVYAWLTASCINFIFVTQLNSLKKIIAGMENQIHYGDDFFIILLLALFLISIHDSIIDKSKGRKLSKRFFIVFAFPALVFMI